MALMTLFLNPWCQKLGNQVCYMTSHIALFISQFCCLNNFCTARTWVCVLFSHCNHHVVLRLILRVQCIQSSQWVLSFPSLPLDGAAGSPSRILVRCSRGLVWHCLCKAPLARNSCSGRLRLPGPCLVSMSIVMGIAVL